MAQVTYTLKDVPIKLLPEIPTSIVCKTCKQETGFTKEDILEMTINEDICCPTCSEVIYSCLPVRPSFSSGGYWANGVWNSYD